ncbi:hypothetical protein NX059_012418 [Plenodomus lindquistii]|nr:hypothetical protein NX059_012418 [Plenodomus lindquistii]
MSETAQSSSSQAPARAGSAQRRENASKPVQTARVTRSRSKRMPPHVEAPTTDDESNDDALMPAKLTATSRARGTPARGPMVRARPEDGTTADTSASGFRNSAMMRTVREEAEKEYEKIFPGLRAAQSRAGRPGASVSRRPHAVEAPAIHPDTPVPSVELSSATMAENRKPAHPTLSTMPADRYFPSQVHPGPNQDAHRAPRRKRNEMGEDTQTLNRTQKSAKGNINHSPGSRGVLPPAPSSTWLTAPNRRELFRRRTNGGEVAELIVTEEDHVLDSTRKIINFSFVTTRETATSSSEE